MKQACSVLGLDEETLHALKAGEAGKFWEARLYPVAESKHVHGGMECAIETRRQAGSSRSAYRSAFYTRCVQ
eukprot:766753-Hanusia_phi.AAC.7